MARHRAAGQRDMIMRNLSTAQGRLEVLQVYKLLYCVCEKDKEQIEKLVKMGVPNLINLSEPQSGNSVLHLAAVANDTEMCSFLLSLGAQSNVQDRLGRTPLMRAVQLGHDSVVAVLAEAGADMKIVDVEGKGVLFYCISPTKRHLRCLQMALKHDADVNNCSLKGKPVFLLACEQAKDCNTMCMNILERGGDPNATDEATGRTALMEAARAGHAELVRALLQKGANVNSLDKKRNHAGHFAAEGGFFEVIQMFSAYSADLGVVALDGNTPIHYAAIGGFADCCKFLSQRGCNPKLKNLEGATPRMLAKEGGHKAAMKELRKAERLYTKLSKLGAANANEPWALRLHDWSFENEAALRSAFQDTNEGGDGENVPKETFIAVLLQHGAPADLEEIQKVVMAHDRSREGTINITEFLKGSKFLQKAFLISSYGPKKKKDKKGKKGKKKGKFSIPMPICTVPAELIYRREDGGPPQFMIESYQHHTDTSRFDRDHLPGHPVEDDSAWYIDEPEKIYININYCAKTGDFESLDLAFSQGVPVDVKDKFYKTPLMCACATGNYEVAKYLLGIGADVNSTDQFSWTPLHHACHAGQLDIIDLLVKSGASIDAPAINGATPLMRAIESCRPGCVEYLIAAGAKVQIENKKEQNALDIAKAYADFRIIDLVQAKFDTLPKPKDKKRKGNPPQKAKAAVKDKVVVSQNPVTTPSSDMGGKKESLRESIIFQNRRITSGAVNKVDISFVPKTVWGKQPTTSQLIRKKREQRERHSYEVDFEDFVMPFQKNIMQKSLEMGGVED
ncbi:ankyrin repeat and EF-hand domain-containing protein 1 isoform X2 [Amia ocellicauda]|uniref:ankyrin repeat and EF-hand domain-containing protein 1 isoform X2 n=1 Tax=Amia ocellicauda TaxID=2972642 RepID=UPI003463F16A